MISEVITPSDVYWITRFDPAGNLLATLAVTAAIGAVVLLAVGCAMRLDGGDAVATGKRLHRSAPWVAAASIALATATTALPTTKEAVAIIVVPKIANNEDIQGLGSEFATMAREWMQELRPAKPVESGK